LSNSRDGFEVDLTGYKERQSARLEPGKYLVRITDAETGETKNHDPKVTLFYTVVGTSFNGQPLVDTLTLTEKALFRVVKVMRAVGLPVEKKKVVIPFRQLLGRTMCVTVADGDEYNGVVKSEVRDYAPAAMYVSEHGVPTSESEAPAADAQGSPVTYQETEEKVDEASFTEEKSDEFDGEDPWGSDARINGTEVELPAEEITL
jgi:uncharacterized protein DUF669